MKKSAIPVEFLRECFDVDFESGLLTWRPRPEAHFVDSRAASLWNGRHAGKVAGGPHKEGYIAITLTHFGSRHILLAHRVLWCMRTGSWPRFTIDHRDMNRTNNRFDNLREATFLEQAANRRAIRSGLKGASFDKDTGRYVSQITRCGKNYFLGRFKTEAEAHNAYVLAAQSFHGEFARAA